jgi:hypothetical protein
MAEAWKEHSTNICQVNLCLKCRDDLLTFVTITVTYPKSRSQRDAFREGTPKGGAGAVLVGVAIHCARGRLGHRPVRHVPDCEVLAALVPERVLPFASGDSRKRGPGRAESKISDAAVGRRKASAPAPFFEVQGGLGPPAVGRQERGRAPHRLSMRLPVGALLGAPPPFF